MIGDLAALNIDVIPPWDSGVFHVRSEESVLMINRNAFWRCMHHQAEPGPSTIPYRATAMRRLGMPDQTISRRNMDPLLHQPACMAGFDHLMLILIPQLDIYRLDLAE